MPVIGYSKNLRSPVATVIYIIIIFKEGLIAFNDALLKHNIDLNRYKKMLEDKRAFERTLEKKAAAGKLPKGRKRFQFPKGVKDTITSDTPKPEPEIV